MVTQGLSTPPPAVSKRAVLLELTIVGVFAAGYLLAFRSRPGYVDLLLAVVAMLFIVSGYARSSKLWKLQRSDEEGEPRLRRAMIATGLFTAAALVVLLAIGVTLAARAGGFDAVVGRLGNPYFLAAVALYFPWALLQQFVFQFYLLGRLLVVLPLGGALAMTALAFCLVHYPRWPVMAVTLVAGAVWALIYRRYRVLLPLAISHALLGSALHYWVFGRDLVASWLSS